jgi:hypothetical protein
MCRYISARKKLIHAMSLDIDQAINRAMVVGCAISATRNERAGLSLLPASKNQHNRRLMHRSENHLRLMVAAQRGRALPGLRGEVAASMDAA